MRCGSCGGDPPCRTRRGTCPLRSRPTGSAHDFRFHTGETMPEAAAALHDPGSTPGTRPVLIIHGTAGTGTGLLAPGFGGQLFGAGQPLDGARYFIILPDTIGAGPVVQAVRRDARPVPAIRLRRHGAGRVPPGHRRAGAEPSAPGAGQTPWAACTCGTGRRAYPSFMTPWCRWRPSRPPMASRNWMLRRMLIETIRQDPEYKGGDYTKEPASLRLVNVLFGIATSGGTLPTRVSPPRTPRRTVRGCRPRRATPRTPTTTCISGMPPVTSTPPPSWG